MQRDPGHLGNVRPTDVLEQISDTEVPGFHCLIQTVMIRWLLPTPLTGPTSRGAWDESALIEDLLMLEKLTASAASNYRAARHQSATHPAEPALDLVGGHVKDLRTREPEVTKFSFQFDDHFDGRSGTRTSVGSTRAKERYVQCHNPESGSGRHMGERLKAGFVEPTPLPAGQRDHALYQPVGQQGTSRARWAQRRASGPMARACPSR